MSGDLWAILGIAPTQDETLIRRAYAVALKRNRPDDDPEAFVRLRSAYEAAMGQAARAQARPLAPTTPAPSPAAEPQPAPVAAPPGLEQRVAAMIQEGDVQQAAAQLLSCRGDTALAIGPWMALSDFLAARLAQDPAIAEPVVQAIARDFGWYGASTPPATQSVNTLRGRIEAARWLAAVRADAAKSSRFVGNERAAACALLLGKGWIGPRWLLPPYTELATLLPGVQVYGPWVNRALNKDRVERLRALVANTQGQQWRRFVAILLVAVSFAAAGVLRDAFLCVLVMSRMRLGWLGRFTLAALMLAGATALARISGNEKAELAAAYCTYALIGAYIIGAAVTLAKSLRRINWLRAGSRVGLAGLGLSVASATCLYFSEQFASVLRPYGIDGVSGAFCFFFGVAFILFIIDRAGGGGPDRPPWGA